MIKSEESLGSLNSKHFSQYPVLEQPKSISFPQNGKSIQDIISTITIMYFNTTIISHKA